MAQTPLTPPERVRERMRRWMDTTGISQRDFAGDLKKSQVWLQKVLAGENQVRLKDLDQVAQAMRSSAPELVRGTDDRYQLEVTPTELRLVEHLRRRQDLLLAVATILGITPHAPQLHTPSKSDAKVPIKRVQ